MITHLFGAKGGVATTTMTCALALTNTPSLVLSPRPRDVHDILNAPIMQLRDIAGRIDERPVLCASLDPTDSLSLQRHHIASVIALGRRVFIDWTTVRPELTLHAANYVVMCTELTYLGMRHAILAAEDTPVDMTIVFGTAGAVLGRKDLDRVIGDRYVMLDRQAAIARSLDAGMFDKAAQHVLQQLRLDLPHLDGPSDRLASSDTAAASR